MPDLTWQLETQREQSEARRERRRVDVMHRAASGLLKRGIEKTALQVGDVAPRFRLANTHGAVVDVYGAASRPGRAHLLSRQLVSILQPDLARVSGALGGNSCMRRAVGGGLPGVAREFAGEC